MGGGLCRAVFKEFQIERTGSSQNARETGQGPIYCLKLNGTLVGHFIVRCRFMKLCYQRARGIVAEARTQL